MASGSLRVLCALLLSFPSLVFAVIPTDPNATAVPNPSGNPYVSIVDRNPFALKPPPPPVEEKPAETAPPPPVAKVVLTGILNVFGPRRALFEITENLAGKQPNTDKPILREGERHGPVEVLSIDVEKSLVRIKNGSLETNLTFEVAKQTGPGLVPVPAGAPPPLPTMNTMMPAPATSAVVPMTSLKGATGRGIVLAGAQPARNSGNAGFNPGMMAMNTVGGGVPGLNNQLDAGLNIPPRQIRGGQPLPEQQPIQHADPVAQWISMKGTEMQHQQRGLDFPPTPPIPELDDSPVPTPNPTGPGQGGLPGFQGLVPPGLP